MIEIRHENMKETKAIKNAYDTIYDDSGIELKDSFYIWISKFFSINENIRFIDIASGFGKLTKIISNKTNMAFGIDFSESAVKQASKKFPMCYWQIGDGESLPFASDSFDVITNIGSIEHYQNPGRGIEEISRILKKSGIACIMLPNTFSLLGNVKNVLLKGDVFDDGQPLQRYNTKRGWERLLINHGLLSVKVLKYERIFPRTLDDTYWYLTHPIKFLHVLIGYFIPMNLINCFVYICVKKENN
jgi:SAM-dependent methyltransferase